MRVSIDVDNQVLVFRLTLPSVGGSVHNAVGI